MDGVYVFLVVLLAFQVEDLKAQSIDTLISNAANSSDSLDFMSEDGGIIRTEIDMLFTFEEWKEILELNKTSARNKRKAIRRSDKRWTNKVVPYEIEGRTFSGYQQQQIKAALQEWMTHTCLQFRRATNSDSYKIRFQNGGGCSSYVGMQGRLMPRQPVSLASGCRIKRIIVHEVGHAIGFQHEQTRPDRDQHVSISRRNIPPHLYFNFDKYSTNVVNDYGVPYDYKSVMHYGNKAFSTNGQYTIIPKNRAFLNVIGNAPGLSFKDIKLANKMYDCSEDCSQKQCPGEGFLGKDCTCYCPGNPIKKCDGTEGGEDGGEEGGDGGDEDDDGDIGDCSDRNRQCGYWASMDECKKNPAYMLSFCKKSCKKCRTVTVTTERCLNLNHYCDAWQRLGFCKTGAYTEYMKMNCKKACVICQAGSERATTCVNKHRLCDHWSSTGQCFLNAVYMQQNCAKACVACG